MVMCYNQSSLIYHNAIKNEIAQETVVEENSS